MILLLLGAWGCTPTPLTAPEDYLEQVGLPRNSSPQQFQICYTGGCSKTADIHLSDQQWAGVRALFATPRTAEEERATIAQAIRQLETLSGQQSPTHNDKSRNLAGFGEPGQMDCVDESTNTTLYLLLLQQDNLLQHHTVLYPASRGFFINGYPHRTANIQDQHSDIIYVVDSWFEDNGVEPHILPYEEWASGWSPPE